MARSKITFDGPSGSLAGALEFPDTEPKAYALFAHCFTCGKDSAAASRISRTLAANGIGVLRFDFTGLGGSDGDFANAGFSSNIADLVAAADWLRQTHGPPALLIGHSLGGTAVLAAADRIPDSKAVVTIGSPSSPEHVLKQFAGQAAVIDAEGVAEVDLGGRTFCIAKSFVDDLRDIKLGEQIARLRRALLIMHAPMDNIVNVDEAATIFTQAKHPKSFVSLDGANHLLTSVTDAQYVGTTIAAWANRYLPPLAPSENPAVAGGHVWVGEGNQKFLRHVATDDHAWLSDEPRKMGGDNLGPDPYEHLLAALGTCTSMTIRMYANQKKWPLEDVHLDLSHTRVHAWDSASAPDENRKIDQITRRLHLIGDLTQEQRERLTQIADRCPVHRTLTNEIEIQTELVEP
ncbi:MAG: putative OsmC-like protein/alpha/beta superfamily hydrolase [Gammaproteobacteria bacterium]